MSRSRSRMKSEANSDIIEADSDFHESPSDLDMDTSVAWSSKVQPEAAATKPNGKKRKVGTNDPVAAKLQSKRLKKKHGPVNDLEDMPVDILLEIFVYLDSADLLNLVRTNKGIRSFLRNKNTRTLWINSFDNLEPPLPECPEDVSEIAYAALAFDKACSFCSRQNITVYTAWECRLRICTKCLEAHFTEHLKDLGYGYGFSTAKSLPSFRSLRGKVGSRTPYKRYLWKDKDREWEAEYANLKEADKHPWAEEKMIHSVILQKHSALCQDWEMKKDKLNAKDQSSSVEDRLSLVLAHVRKMGWGEDLDKLSSAGESIKKLVEVKKACQKSMTHRALQALEPVLTKHMEGLKEERLNREQEKKLQGLLTMLREAYGEYLDGLPLAFDYATAGDIYQLPIIRDIINDGLSSELTTNHIDRLQAAFPQVQGAWKASVRTQLLTTIEVACASEFQGVNSEAVLGEASTAFRCSSCSNYVPVKDTFIHSCAYPPSWINRNPRWNHQIFSFHPSVVATVKETLRSLGYDPERLTTERLNQANPIIECLLFHSEVSGRCTMQWNMLAAHLQSHDKAKNVHGVHQYIRLIEEPQAVVVRSRIAEVLEMTLAGSHNYRSAMCQRCGEMGRYALLLGHTRTKHFIARPKLGEDIIANPSFTHNSTYRLWPPLAEEDVGLLLANKSDSCDICLSTPSSVVEIE